MQPAKKMQSTKNHKQAQLASCLDNAGYAVLLEKGKVYQVIPDADAASFGEVRMIDETGKDYLFPACRFAPVILPQGCSRERASA